MSANHLNNDKVHIKVVRCHKYIKAKPGDKNGGGSAAKI